MLLNVGFPQMKCIITFLHEKFPELELPSFEK